MVERSHKPAAINAASGQEDTATVIADSDKVTLKLQTGRFLTGLTHYRDRIRVTRNEQASLLKYFSTGRQ